MATLRASSRSRSSRPIRFALGADGFMATTASQKRRTCTVGDRKGRVNDEGPLLRRKLLLAVIRIFDRWGRVVFCNGETYDATFDSTFCFEISRISERTSPRT